MGKRKALRPGTGNLARGRFLPLPGIFPQASDLATSPAVLWIEAALLTRLKEALSTGHPQPPRLSRLAAGGCLSPTLFSPAECRPLHVLFLLPRIPFLFLHQGCRDNDRSSPPWTSQAVSGDLRGSDI